MCEKTKDLYTTLLRKKGKMGRKKMVRVCPDKILKWVCPDCGKVIVTIYEAQLNYNRDAHILTHKSKKETEEKDLGGG